MQYEIVDGKIRTYGLEFSAAEHCNLHCFGCSQSSPFLKPAYPDLDMLKQSLHFLSRILKPENFIVLGGEPLLNPQLNQILDIGRGSGMFDYIYVTTNGILLHRMEALFWELTDIISLSVYPGTKHILEPQIPTLKKIADKYDVALIVDCCDEFSHINLSGPLDDGELVQRIYNTCVLSNYCHTLYDGRFYKCHPVACRDRFLASFGVKTNFGEVDGVVITSVPDLYERVYEYLMDMKPLNGCTYCLGTCGRAFAHRLLRAGELGDLQDYVFHEVMLDTGEL